MLDGQRFGDDGTSTAGSEQAGDRDHQVDEKKSQVPHNPDSLPSAQPFASLGFRLDLSDELRYRHQQLLETQILRYQLSSRLKARPDS